MKITTAKKRQVLACANSPKPSKTRVFASSPASATPMHNGWSRFSTAGSCWLVSVDGVEEGADQWEVLEEILAAKRRRNDRLPIFLFGDKRTAEMVPAGVLKHANAFMHLFEDSPTFLARVIARAANLYLERLPPPMFKALMDYTLHASYSWHTPGHGGGTAFRKSPVGHLFYQFFGRTLSDPTSPSQSECWALCSIIRDR